MSLYSPETDPKYQRGDAVDAASLPPDVVVSPDTRRADRIPPGQHRTRKWPVLHATSVPVIDPEIWRLSVDGLVNVPHQWTLEEFRQLPRIRVFADFHCVTTWSRLSNLWEGVSVNALLRLCGIQPTARFAIVGAMDGEWTTNLPLHELLHDDVLLADTHDGQPIDADHGGPVRLVVPRLFAWKSAKWANQITLCETDRAGYWEQRGYHDYGDPWKSQRFRDS